MIGTAAACHAIDGLDGGAYSAPVSAKRKTMTRDKDVRTRVNEAEEVAFVRAASRVGLDLSSWLRMVARKAAEETLGEPIPDLPGLRAGHDGLEEPPAQVKKPRK